MLIVTRTIHIVLGLIAWVCLPLPLYAQGRIFSSGGLATSGIVPGAKAGADVFGTAAAYSEITFQKQLFYGEPNGSWRVQDPPVIQDITGDLKNTTFQTGDVARPTVTGKGDVRKKIPPPQSVTVKDTVYNMANLPIAVGRGTWESFTNKKSTLAAEAFVNKKYTGYAAGYANDPYAVYAGTYQYAPALDGSLELDAGGVGSGSYANVFLSAEVPGLVSGELWTLDLRLPANGNLGIDFLSDPILGLDDTKVADDLRKALDLSTPDVVRLKSQYISNGYRLFDTSFTANSDFEYGETVGAVVRSVPEPASCTLFSVGTLGLLAIRQRRRRKA